MTPAKSERPITKQDMREDAINSLRQWRVRVGKVDHIVMAHSSALASGGVLMFYVHTDDGMKARHIFKVWSACEEIIPIDGSQSASLNN
jgi:hypothetical protein